MKLYTEEELKNSVIGKASRSYIRGGNFLIKVFRKDTKILSSEECMHLMNTYGIPPEYVFLMALSHEFTIDTPGFLDLIEEQKEQSKKMKQCGEKDVGD
jgi:alanyl-tRNA synthetase